MLEGEKPNDILIDNGSDIDNDDDNTYFWKEFNEFVRVALPVCLTIFFRTSMPFTDVAFVGQLDKMDNSTNLTYYKQPFHNKKLNFYFNIDNNTTTNEPRYLAASSLSVVWTNISTVAVFNGTAKLCTIMCSAAYGAAVAANNEYGNEKNNNTHSHSITDKNEKENRIIKLYGRVGVWLKIGLLVTTLVGIPLLITWIWAGKYYIFYITFPINIYSDYFVKCTYIKIF